MPTSDTDILFVGHSLFSQKSPDYMRNVVNSFDDESTIWSQIINGSSIKWSWDNSHTRSNDSQVLLESGDVDVLILTEAVVVQNHIRFSDTFEYAQRYYDLAVSNNPDAKVFIHETWTRITEPSTWRESLDTDLEVWQSIVDSVNATLEPGQPEVQVIPMGSAMARLYDEIELGLVPGIDDIRDIFADAIHLNDIGHYFMTMVQYATIHEESPVGLPIHFENIYGVDYTTPSQELATYFQELAWEVVTTDDRLDISDDSTVDDDDSNGLPVAENDEAETDEDVAVTISVLANDSDPDDDVLSVSAIGDADSGTVSINTDGTIDYVPDAGFFGTDTFDYTISDGNGGTATGSVDVTVNEIVDPLTPTDDDLTIINATSEQERFTGSDAEERFVFEPGDSNDSGSMDQIFNFGNGDLIDVSAFDFTGVRSTDDAQDASKLTVGQFGDSVVMWGGSWGGAGDNTFMLRVEDVDVEDVLASLIIDATDIGSPDDQSFGEVGSVNFAQANSDQWHTVSFTETIEDAVIVMGPPTSNGGDPATIRIQNVTEDGFEFQLDEWDYLGGAHIAETISWMAVSRGTHELEDGTTLVADSAQVGTTASVQSFGTDLDDAIVFADVNGVNDSSAVTTRINSVTSDGFSVSLQEEEAADGVHAIETVDWIAIETGSGDGFEANVTGAQTDEVIDTFVFAEAYDESPALFADMQTMRGPDTATTRLDNLDEEGFSAYIQEEKSRNREVNHADEVLGWLAIEEGILM